MLSSIILSVTPSSFSSAFLFSYFPIVFIYYPFSCFPLFLPLHVSLSSYLSLFFISLLSSLFHDTQFYTSLLVLSLSFVLSCLPYFTYTSAASRKHALLFSHNPCTVFHDITSNHKINSEKTLRDPNYNCCLCLGHYLSWRNNIGSLKTQIKISSILWNIDYRYLKKV
jgi:hypothetical protein